MTPRLLAPDGRPTCPVCKSLRYIESESGSRMECQDCPDLGGEEVGWEESPVVAVERSPELLREEYAVEPPHGTSIPLSVLRAVQR